MKRGFKMENPQNCYIRVVNGMPFEHPLVEDNLKQVIINFDPNNLPKGLEPFIRKPYPQIGFLETFVGTTYEKIDGVWQDVHNIRPLSEEEKAAKIQFAKDTFIFSDTWLLNETTGEWMPPVPYPTDGKLYSWDNEKLQWAIIDNDMLKAMRELQQYMGIPDDAINALGTLSEKSRKI